MRFPFYIARRYLVSKKSTNVINLISGISVFGVTLSTVAIIIIMSVFNGLNDLMKSLLGSFDPDLKITAIEGKRFDPSKTVDFEKLLEIPGIASVNPVIEENALLRYGKKEHIATLKGVEKSYRDYSGLDTMLIDGQFMLQEDNMEFAVVGAGVAGILGIGLQFIDPLIMYVPKRTASKNLNLENATIRKVVFPSGIFSVQQEIDSRYVVVSLELARQLFGYKTEVSAIEIAFTADAVSDEIQSEVKKILGPEFEVKNRFEQQELIFKTIKSEKLMAFLILTFILFVASFNIIGSLTMLIIDKKKDIETLRSLGANAQSIRQIFLLEGWLISIAGAVFGLILGISFVLVQQYFGIIKLYGSGNFIIDSYPVLLEWNDILLVFGTVVSMGYLAAWYPVRYVTRKYL